jgi:hypothetical protein
MFHAEHATKTPSPRLFHLYPFIWLPHLPVFLYCLSRIDRIAPTSNSGSSAIIVPWSFCGQRAPLAQAREVHEALVA